MSWTTPGTAVAGAVLSSAFWNEQVRDNSAAIRDVQTNVQQTHFRTPLDISALTAGTFTEVTGIACSITPSSNSSKILVMASISFSASSGLRGLRFRLYRGGSHLTAASGSTSLSKTPAWIVGYPGTETTTQGVACGWYLDSPATTSSTTYTIYVGSQHTSADSFSINRCNTDANDQSTTLSTSTLTLMEVPV